MTSDHVQRRIDRLLDEIEEVADQREWHKVRELAEDLLAFAPDNTDARTFLEAAERRLSGQQGSRGDERVDSQADLIAVPGLTRVARHLGAAERLMGNYSKALCYLRQSVEIAGKVRIRPEIALSRLE